MLEPYNDSVIPVYRSTTATTLQGSLICFFELQDQPVMFATINQNILTIFLINPYFDINSFIAEIPSHASDLTAPLYLFNYDRECLRRYDAGYQTHLKEFFANYIMQEIESNKYATIEDFYSFTLPECYGPFFNVDMYLRFAKSKDLFEICNFVRSVMFSKLVLVIDSFTEYSFTKPTTNDIALVMTGHSPVSLPASSCLLDIQTIGLDEYSDIIVFTLYKQARFFTYYSNNKTPEGQLQFRSFIDRSLQSFEVIYVLNAEFMRIFLPQFTNYIDMRFEKYQKWVSTRKLVHLPHFHLEIDPGSGKNIPIWNKLYWIDRDEKWKTLVLQRTITNLTSKVAILSSNELKIPFSDPIIADTRRLIPPLEFTSLFVKKNSILKKKICFRPLESHDNFNSAYDEYSKMFEDNLIMITEE